MKKPLAISYARACIIGLALCAGCGGEEENLAVAPPAPPTAGADAGVSLAPATSATQVPDPSAPRDVAAPPPEQIAATGTNDMFKGLNPQQVEELKAGTTLETHDLNLDPLNEAVTGFMAEYRRAPANQEEMVKARYLPRVLHAPKGKRYVINQESGEVTVEN